jgi:hypothetical protein
MQVQDITEKTRQGKHASFFAAASVMKKKKFYEIGTWGDLKLKSTTHLHCNHLEGITKTC